MGDAFEKILLVREIITQKELEHYKSLQEKDPRHPHIGDILLEKKRIDAETLEKLKNEEKKSNLHKKQKRDKKVLEAIQKLGIVRQQEIAYCLRLQREAQSRSETVFLSDLFIEKRYLTPYLVDKLYRRGTKPLVLPEGTKRAEDLVIDIPKYLKDRFLAKILVKNHLISPSQLSQCWKAMKRSLYRKYLAHILLEQNLISEQKLRVLLAILKQALPEKYPYFHAHVRDTKLARILVKRNFLSPWRINKCLSVQLGKIKNKDYSPLRLILTEKGYLSDYQFDIVLRKYGELVQTEIPSLFLVPPDEEDGGDWEREVGAGISVILDREEEVDSLNLEEIWEESNSWNVDEVEFPHISQTAWKKAGEMPVPRDAPEKISLSDVEWKDLQKSMFEQTDEIKGMPEAELLAQPADEEESFQDMDVDFDDMFEEVSEEYASEFEGQETKTKEELDEEARAKENPNSKKI